MTTPLHKIDPQHVADAHAGISAATAAGVPWGTILQWILQYGPQFGAIVQQLIQAFKGGQQATP